MEFYLVRHAHAEKREEWQQDDLSRPLRKKGEKRADAAFTRFSSLFSPPQIILTSFAERARRTGEILGNHCGAPLEQTAKLNPGASVLDYEAVLQEYEGKGIPAVVGHEPDMSRYISYCLTGGKLTVAFGKGAVCHIAEGALVNLIQQKYLL